MAEDSFDWVTARHACSVAAVFEQLKETTEQDVKIRNSLRSEDDDFGPFRFHATPNSFRVFVEGECRNEILGSVRFKLADDEIQVSQDDQPFFAGTATLCNDRVCRLRVKDTDLDLWQFRKEALEGLFFRLTVR